MVLEKEKGETKPMKILLTIAYAGTRYSGWQKQKSPEVLTVEGEVEKALRTLFRIQNWNVSVPVVQTEAFMHWDSG